ILNQAANAAVKHKGSIFEIVYRRLVPRLGHNKTIGVIAHRLCHLIWIILHNGVRYEERGPAVSEKSRQRHTARMIRTLRILGYRVEPLGNPARRTRFSTHDERDFRPSLSRPARLSLAQGLNGQTEAGYISSSCPILLETCRPFPSITAAK